MKLIIRTYHIYICCGAKFTFQVPVYKSILIHGMLENEIESESRLIYRFLERGVSNNSSHYHTPTVIDPDNNAEMKKILSKT